MGLRNTFHTFKDNYLSAMLKLDSKRNIGLFFKKIEYQYATFVNNREIKRAFVPDYHRGLLDRATALSKNYFLIYTVIGLGFISLSLISFTRSVSFSKQTPLNIEIKKEIQEKIQNKIQKEMLKFSPVIKSLSGKMEAKLAMSELPKQKTAISNPIISREIFMENEAKYTLFVNKLNKKMFVTEKEENGYIVVKEFPISIGLVSGDKNVEGDRKTPEGTYTLIDLITEEELPKRYGPYAAVLNYPSEKDLKEGKTGSGIWVHGTEENELTPDTLGCVELSNENLLKLYPFIGRGTEIIIVPNNVDISPKNNIIQKDFLKLSAIF